MSAKAPLPLHVVTGFLGAGKTTLINRLLRAPELEGALVVVNEFGEVGLDHLLYERIADDVVLIGGGCLCCQVRGDLVDALHDLLDRRDSGALTPFTRIVLETSGLADPAPILHTLIADPVLARRLRLAGVTTLVDARNGASTLERHGEARRQIALADRMLLSKSDLVADPTAMARLRASLADLNPAAPILDLTREPFGAREFLAPASEAAPRPRASRMSAHGASARAQAFTTATPIEAHALSHFLDLVQRFAGPRLLRVKGLVATREAPENPWLIQGAQHAMHPPERLPAWPDARRETRLVVITDGIAAETIESLWRALIGAPEIDRADLAALADNPLAPRRGGLLG